MIISNTHHFIFTAIPKTGTHSVRRALREHLAANDMEQVALFVDRRLPFEDLAKLQHGHLTLRQIRPHLGDHAFASFFKFAFVRNPYDRFVSYCAFMTRDGGEFAMNPLAAMKHILFRLKPEHHILFRPQHEFITDDNGALLTDYIGRVEDMQAGYDGVCRRLGLPSRGLERVNHSRRGDFRQYYDEELREGVRDFYRYDFELLGYPI